MNKKGFTLIECFIILAIIGISVALILPQINEYTARTYDSQTKASLHNLFLTCKSFWSKDNSNRPCKLDKITEASYGFLQDINIKLAINSGEEKAFNAHARHISRNTSYSIDSLGNISKNN